MEELTHSYLQEIIGGSIPKNIRPPRIYLPGPIKPKFEIM